MSKKTRERKQSMTQPPITRHNLEEIKSSERAVVSQCLEILSRKGHRKRILGIMTARFGKDAEDYIQDACTEFLEKPDKVLKSLDSGNSIETMLILRATARALNATKRNARFELADFQFIDSLIEGPKATQELFAELDLIFTQAIENGVVTSKEIERLLARERDGFTYDQLAKDAGKSEGFVRRRLKKTLLALQAMIGGFFAAILPSKATQHLGQITLVILAASATMLFWEGAAKLVMPRRQDQQINKKRKRATKKTVRVIPQKRDFEQRNRLTGGNMKKLKRKLKKAALTTVLVGAAVLPQKAPAKKNDKSKYQTKQKRQKITARPSQKATIKAKNQRPKKKKLTVVADCKSTRMYKATKWRYCHPFNRCEDLIYSGKRPAKFVCKFRHPMNDVTVEKLSLRLLATLDDSPHPNPNGKWSGSSQLKKAQYKIRISLNNVIIGKEVSTTSMRHCAGFGKCTTSQWEYSVKKSYFPDIKSENTIKIEIVKIHDLLQRSAIMGWMAIAKMELIAN